MGKQSFSKIKKILPILLTFFFLATLTVASASAEPNNPKFDGHVWSINENHMRYDGQFWWDDIHHMKWDGHHWWKGHKWWDGRIWH
jgi:hypothetical protein